MLPERVPDTIQNKVGLMKLEESNGALKKVLSTPEGRLVFAEFFKTFHMYTSPHNDHGAKTSFNCGQQSVCIWFREWIKTAGIYPFYQTMEKEDMDRTERWNVELKKLMENPKERK